MLLLHSLASNVGLLNTEAEGRFGNPRTLDMFTEANAFATEVLNNEPYFKFDEFNELFSRLTREALGSYNYTDGEIDLASLPPSGEFLN